MIKVDYEELPAVFTPEEALAEGAPLIHEEYPRNLCAEVHQEFGDVASAFKECDLIRTDTFINKRQDAAFLEPCGCIADFDVSGHMTLWSSSQAPHYVQRTDRHGAEAAHRKGAGGEALRGWRFRAQGGRESHGAGRLPAFHENAESRSR